MKNIIIIVFTIFALGARPVTADQLPNVLETISVYASSSLDAALQDAQKLHASVEDLLYEPESGARQAAVDASDKAQRTYLQTEIYGIIGHQGFAEVHRLINAVSVEGCRPDYEAENSVGGLAGELVEGEEVSSGELYELQLRTEDPSTGFGVVQYLLTADYDKDFEGQRHQYMLACAGLLTRNIEELQKIWQSDDFMTAGAPEGNLERILDAAILQAQRNQKLFANADCADDLMLSDIIEANALGLYRLWAGLYDGEGATGDPGTGLNALFKNRADKLGERISDNLRTLNSAGRVLGDTKIRQDKDEHLAVFSVRTRGKISSLLAEQIELWTALLESAVPLSLNTSTD